MKKLVIIGNNEFAEIASVYFEKDYGYTTEAFLVNKEYITNKELINHPVLDYANMRHLFDPSEYVVFCSPVYTKLNRLRTRFYQECKEMGYSLATYVSPHSFVWDNVEIGDNCFIFENNTVQYNAKIGNNVILWSGNHIGHSAIIEDNCFVSSHVVVSGYTRVGENSFLGVNSTLSNNISFPSDSILAAGAVLTNSIEEEGVIMVGNPAKKSKKSAYEYFGLI